MYLCVLTQSPSPCVLHCIYNMIYSTRNILLYSKGWQAAFTFFGVQNVLPFIPALQYTYYIHIRTSPAPTHPIINHGARTVVFVRESRSRESLPTRVTFVLQMPPAKVPVPQAARLMSRRCPQMTQNIAEFLLDFRIVYALYDVYIRTGIIIIRTSPVTVRVLLLRMCC